MKTYEIWSEGYSATGDRAGAVRLGVMEGLDFKDACVNLMSTRKSLWDLYSTSKNTYWGCQLYNTEQEARKSFG